MLGTRFLPRLPVMGSISYQHQRIQIFTFGTTTVIKNQHFYNQKLLSRVNSSQPMLP